MKLTRNKKWQKRFFTLKNGVLSYSKKKGKEVKDSMILSEALDVNIVKGSPKEFIIQFDTPFHMKVYLFEYL